MPLVTIIVARLLALQDWFLAQWVDASVVNTSTSCYMAYQLDANVNACGQQLLRSEIFEEWMELLAATSILIPSVLGSF
jgi:hypothetical protein